MRQTLWAIPVYNRFSLLQDSLATIKELEGLDQIDVVIFDDCSTEFSQQDLQAAAGPSFKVVSWPKNSGRADFAVHRIFEYAVDANYEFVVICDSDLIVSSNALQFILTQFHHTDGILSLFNANAHFEASGSLNPDLVLKESIGFAGSVWSLEVLRDVLRNVPVSTIYDWDICAYMRGRRKVYCARASQVQHFGTEGQNSNHLAFDFGRGFSPSGTSATTITFERMGRLVFSLQDHLKEEREYSLRRNNIDKVIAFSALFLIIFSIIVVAWLYFYIF